MTRDQPPVDLPSIPGDQGTSKQTTVNLRDRMAEWPSELIPSATAYQRPRQKQGISPRYGPRSLGDIALDVLAANADQLDARHIEGLSDTQRTLLKKAITGNSDLSAKLWKILLPRQAYPLPGSSPRGSAAQTQMFCSQVRDPQTALGSYMEALTAPSMEFVAHIRIHACGTSYFGYDELVKLAGMPNLGVLEIIEINCPDRAMASGVQYEPPVRPSSTGSGNSHGSSQVNDRLFMGWCSAKPVPFPQLRVLRLWGCMSQALTQRCLEYAAGFPKLAHFEMSVDRIYIQDETSTRPGPGFEDGPRGAWKQVSRYTEKFGWHGFKSTKNSFSYGEITYHDSSGINEKQPRLSLNMVELNSIAHRALEWGGRIYSFAANEGYRDRNHEHLIYDIQSMSQADGFLITYNVASVTLGVDRQIKSYRGEHRVPWHEYTMTFVRTTERLQAQAEANQRYRDEQAQKKAQKEAERQAQTTAQRDAAKAARDAGRPKPLVLSARAKKRAAADSIVPISAKRYQG